jgi:hypothetical protein
VLSESSAAALSLERFAELSPPLFDPMARVRDLTPPVYTLPGGRAGVNGSLIYY